MRARSRRWLAVGGAVVLHGGLLWLRVDDDDVQVKPRVQWERADDDDAPIEVVLVTPPAPVVEPDPAPVVPSTPTSTAPSTSTLPAGADDAAAPVDDVPPSTATAATAATSTAAAEAVPADRAAGAPDAAVAPADRAPRAPVVGREMNDVVTGLESVGPRPSNAALAGALDFQPEADLDRGLGDGARAAARATRRLRRDLAFDDVTVGLGDDWFRGVRGAAERAFRPEPGDLDNPGDVTRQKIAWNYLRDPSSWDDEAKAALEIFLKADQLNSRNAIERLALGNSASTGTSPTSTLRAATVNDLLRRKEAGFSVRFAFEVDVHHAGDGAVTAVDVMRTQFERGLVDKVRQAVEQAVAQAPPVPPRVAGGGPFRSRWLFVATWFIDPPRPRFSSSNSLFAGEDGAPALLFGGTFDVGPDGVTTQDFDVHLKTSAELLDVTPL